MRFYEPGFLGSSSVKNPPAEDIRDTDSIPGSGRSPGKGNGTPVCLPRNPMGIGAWQLTVLGVAKSWTQLSH